MTSKRDAGKAGDERKGARERRLGDRLRQNLRRRKEQARARKQDETPTASDASDGDED